jgi:CheY-like chemotaxis protein/tetratricopeptide (TPR) repeat protein
MPQTSVLCAVENRALARIYQKALTGEGYHVVVVHDGERALQAIEESCPDEILLDVSLPKRDGFEVLQTIRTREESWGWIPVVLLSNCRITPQYRERADSMGAEGFLTKPVPLDLLLSAIAANLKSREARVTGESPAASESRVAERARPASRSRAEVKGRSDKSTESAHMEGNFGELPLPHLLHHLHGLRATGVLLLSLGKKRKALQLRDGYPVAIKSNLITECLGNYLMGEGRLDTKQFMECVARMKQGEGAQGEILVAMEIMDEQEIAEALRRQALEKLFELFEWKQGYFKLERGKRLQGGNALAPDCSPADLVLEGVRKRCPLQVVDQYLDDNGARYVAQAQSPFYRFQEVDLSPEENELVARLDGAERLAEQVDGAEEGVRRTLYALLMTGILELQEKRKAPVKREREVSTRPAVQPAPPVHGDDRALRVELATHAEQLRQQSYYEMLGVDQFSNEFQLRSAYEALARRTHPDRFHSASTSVRGLAEEVYGLVTTAYETLTEPKRRQAYDTEMREDQRRVAKEAEGRRSLEAETEFQKGEAFMRKREYELALMSFGKAVEHNPEEGEYHAHYGWCLHLIHPDNPVMIGEAIEHVRRGIKLARDHEKPYLFLGRLYKAMGRSKAAAKMFAHAVQIRPDSVEAMRELRLLNMRLEKNKGLIGRLLRR